MMKFLKSVTNEYDSLWTINRGLYAMTIKYMDKNAAKFGKLNVANSYSLYLLLWIAGYIELYL